MFQIFGTAVPVGQGLDIVVDTATSVEAGQSPIQIPVGVSEFYVTQNVYTVCGPIRSLHSAYLLEFFSVV